ncbi:nitrite reductase/ring-hydroxylating ferredoxin subunit [Bradyrhizobium sp. LM3.4]
MMLNSNFFTCPLHRAGSARSPHHLPGVVFRVLRCAVHADLAAVTTGMRTEQPSPMPHLAPPPTYRFGVNDNGLDLIRVSGPISRVGA